MTPLLLRYSWLSIMLVVCCVHPSRSQQKVWKQYTTADGLPVNEVFETLQDKQGFLWFGTALGICRFDGYEFWQPVDTSSYAGSEAFVPTEDQAGRIWFARLDRTLWYVEHDTIREWQFNHVLKSHLTNGIIEQLAVETDGTIWIGIKLVGFFIIAPDGSIQKESATAKDKFLFSEVDSKTLYTFIPHHKDSMKGDDPAGSIIELLYRVGKTKVSIGNYTPESKTNSYEAKIWKIGRDSFIYDNLVEFFFIADRNIQWKVHKGLLAQKIFPLGNGALLVASHHKSNYGLFYYRSLSDFRNNDGTNLLPGQFITNIFRDQDGGWWASSINKGIYYCKNQDIDIYTMASGLPSDDVVQLASDGKSKVFIGFRPPHVFSIDSKNKTLEKIGDPLITSREIWGLEFDSENKWLWSSEPLQYHSAGNQWRLADWETRENENRVLSAKKIHIPHGSKHVYISSYSGFKIIKVAERKIIFTSKNVQEFQGRIHAIAIDHIGQTWVTNDQGVWFFERNRLHPTNLGHPALQYQPRDLAPLPSGGMVIGLRGAGIVITDFPEYFDHFTKKDGLASDHATKIRVTTAGDVFVCSNAGLSWLQKQDRNWKIKNISIKDGLPSNQINDVIELNGEIWVATDRGLAHLHGWPATSPVPVPLIQHVQINNEPLADYANVNLSYTQNNVSITYSSLHFPSEGNVTYRYRLIGADTNFQMTTNRNVNFPNLAPGNYVFEVQAAQRDNSYTQPTTLSFLISSPWWRTYWFIALCILATAAIGWLYYSRRLKNIKKEAQQTAKIKDLELAALRAQMNPHFIFNCLNSIQQFISQHKPEEATRYLSRFAKLVRLALHSSVDGKHSLADEINMLDHYLALEQMRFKGAFEYAIRCDQSIDAEAIFIPPLLIQPFIENAVVHGMKSKANDGRIEVCFTNHADTLEVTITDNGPGFITEAPAVYGEHKSLGMKLTKNRLAMIAGHVKGHSYYSENVISDAGHVMGSKITVTLPLQ